MFLILEIGILDLFEFVLSFGFRIAVFRFIFNCAFIKNPALGAGFLITLRKTF